MMSTELLKNVEQLDRVKSEYHSFLDRYKHLVLVCSGAGCVSSNCGLVRDAAINAIKEANLQEEAYVYETGCMGTCAVGPVMLILPERIFYTELTPEKTREIIKAHLLRGEILKQYTFFDHSLDKHVPNIDDIEFFKAQVKIVLRNCGLIDYGRIDAYIANGGYYSAAKALLKMSPMDVVDEVKKSGMRGRGGAGFPTGRQVGIRL